MAIPVNPDEERNRLVELYSSMTDEQLLDLAPEADELTEIARDAFDAEITKRSLALPPRAPEETNVGHRKLVTIRRVRDLPEAFLAKGALQSAGIEAFLCDDNLVRLDWFISTAIGGIRLMVDADQVDAANEVLGQEILSNFHVEGVGEYQQPRCTQCNSLEVTFTGLNKPVAYTSAWIGLPIPLRSNEWKCEHCGNTWEQEPETASETSD